MKRERNKADNTIDMGFKGILYPTKEQKVLIGKTFGCCRFVYNRFLEERKKEYRENGKTVSYIEQCGELPGMKKDPETEWLMEVDSTALQNTVRNLQDAFDSYSDHRTGYPKFKSKHDHRQSYRSTNNNDSIRITDDVHIRLPKLGEVKCKLPRKPEGRILSAAVTLEADGRYTVSLLCEEPKPEEAEKTGKSVGIDLGIRTLAVTSDGKEYDNPKTFEKNRKKLARAQRKLSRKAKGSNNREKQRKITAKIQKKIRNQRVDAIHKMTHELVTEYDVICMEDLDVSGMRKGHFAREVSDAALGEVRRQLKYKSEWAGKQLVTVDRWYPSSQACSACGFINTDVKDLKIRKWKCPVCGAWHDRDLNAAKNILNTGLKKLE